MNQSINTQTQYTIQTDVQHSEMKQKGAFIHTHSSFRSMRSGCSHIDFQRWERIDLDYQDYGGPIRYWNV